MNKSKVTTVVFVSNYFTHHQQAFSDVMWQMFGEGYVFIQTVPMTEERMNMGWQVELPSYVLRSYQDSQMYQQCLSVIRDADVVIAGSAPEKMLTERLKMNKLFYRYSEQIFKKRDFDIARWAKYTLRSFLHEKKNVYYLCSSAYAADDYRKCGIKQEQFFKWGYFPETCSYDDISSLINKKKPHSILWTARFLDWKHPEMAIEVARRLKDEGYSFELNLIGNGILENKIRQQVEETELNQYVHILGSMKPKEVRHYMENSEIFLCTSDRNEGWGAVLNEAMNSACAVVANEEIGAVPFLLKHKENGMIYQNFEQLYNYTKWLLDHSLERQEMSRRAYFTIMEEWNAEIAAQHFVTLANAHLNERSEFAYQKGICSRCKNIKI